MCGISFVLDAGTPSAARGLVLAMHAPIRHRGPDDERFLFEVGDGVLHRVDRAEAITGRVRFAAAFRRLKIIDLSEASAQPMLTADGSVALLYNGEIYNYRELRHELESHGYAFRSAGDTEVVLAAYQRWGTACFARFEGMWAIVLLDVARRKIVVSRDRFGIKPLYWSVDGSRLMLASEAKQIVAARGRVRADQARVALYLRGIRQPTLEDTFFEGIRLVPPASWGELPMDRVETPSFQRYWDLDAFVAGSGGTAPPYREAVEQLDTVLRDAVASHRVADVELGSLLSGGIDSSTLSVMLAALDPNVPTYSFGYRNEGEELSELPYSEAVVRAHGLRNFQTNFDAAWVSANAGRVMRTIEEPILGMSPLAQYRVFEAVRGNGTTVVLDGQGADEVFGGYGYHQRKYLSDRWRNRRYGDFAREMSAIARRDGTNAASFFLREMVLPAIRARFDRTHGVPGWLEPNWGRGDFREMQQAMNDRGSEASQVNAQAHFDIRWGNVKTILLFGDKSSMAHSIEARVPYFDRRVVELALTFPDTYKIHGGEPKRVLRDVARKRLPPMVTERTKGLGFATLQNRWLRGELAAEVRASITDPSLLGAGFLRGADARKLAASFATGSDGEVLEAWRLHALAVWSREFGIEWA